MRKLMCGPVLWIVLAVIGAWASIQPSAAQGILNVYNWNDYIADESLKRFQAETGIKVIYDLYDSNETLDAKLRAGRSGYDLVVPTASPFLAQQIPAGLYRPVDKALLKNHGSLDPETMRDLATFDPGNRYAVPYMLGSTGIGYNAARIRAIMPDAPVGSLKILFDPSIVARFKACGVTLLDAPTEVVPAALAYLGLNPNSKSVDDLAKADGLLGKMRSAVRKWDSSDYINALANGDTCLVLGYSGDIKQAAKRAAETKRGVVIEYAIPAEGAQVGMDVWAIPVDAGNVENAHKFIDFMLRPEIAAQNTNFIGYANPVPASLPMVDAAIRNDPGIYPPEPVRKRLYTLTPADRNYERQRTRTWTRVTTGR